MPNATRRVFPFSLVAAALLPLWGARLAGGVQPPGTSAPPPAAGSPAAPAPASQSPPTDGSRITLDALPPHLRLGARVNLIERQFQVIPTVVIVPEEASYLAAISSWKTGPKAAARFPVLIDNGRWDTRVRIARFVHAFGPSSIVRWRATGEAAKLPTEQAKLEERVESTLAAAWGAASAADLNRQWTAMGFTPPGVVACSTKDPAWTAGIALAAFHGQPIVWIDPPPTTDPTLWMGIEQADAFGSQLRRSLDALGRPYNKLGDDIDAVTLCMTTCSRVFLGQDDRRKFLAFTDLIGRGSEASKRERWAWCGQILGDEGGARAAYDAMSALFLSPRRAWLFDGYDASQPWDAYDMTKAATELSKVGIASLLDDSPSGKGLNDLRMRAAGVRDGTQGDEPAGMGLDVGLAAMTTSGNQDFFDLKPGKALPQDVPILRRPAMVYFVHSFSAASPTSRGTVAGVWRERGAYAYIGSVDEPYLQAFIPTPKFMARLAAGIPWGAAGRMEGGEVWKLTVLGDPLMTFGPQGPRATSGSVPLEGAEDVAGKLPDQLKQRDFLGAMWTLAITGRDKDAARLIAALAKDKAAQLTPEIAVAGLPCAFYSGDYQALLTAAEKAAPMLEDPAAADRAGLAEARDMVWHAIWPSIGHPTPQEADLLAAYMRPETVARDAGEAIKSMDAARGAAASRAVQQRADRIRPQPKR